MCQQYHGARPGTQQMRHCAGDLFIAANRIAINAPHGVTSEMMRVTSIDTTAQLGSAIVIPHCVPVRCEDASRIAVYLLYQLAPAVEEPPRHYVSRTCHCYTSLDSTTFPNPGESKLLACAVNGTPFAASARSAQLPACPVFFAESGAGASATNQRSFTYLVSTCSGSLQYPLGYASAATSADAASAQCLYRDSGQ